MHIFRREAYNLGVLGWSFVMGWGVIGSGRPLSALAVETASLLGLVVLILSAE